MSFLQLEGKTILVTGVANKKSVACHVARGLIEHGANPVFAVRSEERREQVQKLFPDHKIFVCDVEDESQILTLRDEVVAEYPKLAGLVHSIAFANYSDGMKPFHETNKQDFLQAVDISCYSLLALSRAFEKHFEPEASVVSISISTTRMAAENYGYMAPIKAALDSTSVFLAKSFSESGVRFNTVNPGLLKTSASAGIPGYVNSYLYAEQVTLRQQAVTTPEVAQAVLFLLSPASSGINAQSLVIDAGMSTNYFDKTMVKRAMRPD